METTPSKQERLFEMLPDEIHRDLKMKTRNLMFICENFGCARRDDYDRLHRDVG